MIKFEPYPIYINYSMHWQLRFRSQIAELNRQGRYEEEKSLTIKSITSSDSTIENNIWKKEVEQYETTVCQLLKRIQANRVGKILLKILNLKTKFWIVPMPEKDFKRCYCAQTYPLNYQTKPFEGYAIGSGDTYIFFNPDNVFLDDTLFHELVHAYRYSYNKFERFAVNDEYNGEEFLAHQLQNVYLSCLKKEIYFTYKSEEKADKQRIYQHFADNSELIKATEYFSTHEYLAMLAANTITPNIADYNPFRDYKQLKPSAMKMP